MRINLNQTFPQHSGLFKVIPTYHMSYCTFTVHASFWGTAKVVSVWCFVGLTCGSNVPLCYRDRGGENLQVFKSLLRTLSGSTAGIRICVCICMYVRTYVCIYSMYIRTYMGTTHPHSLPPLPSQGHHLAVYSLKWSPFHPNVFASCGADWSVKIWDQELQ